MKLTRIEEAMIRAALCEYADRYSASAREHKAKARCYSGEAKSAAELFARDDDNSASHILRLAEKFRA